MVLPLFVFAGRDARVPIAAMPGHARLSPDWWPTAARAFAAGVPRVLLFGVTDHKDGAGSAAYERRRGADGDRARSRTRCPRLSVITDVCLCEYTDHGHCGVARSSGEVAQRPDARAARSRGAVATRAPAPTSSRRRDMMDGRVGAIRAALDGAGHEDIAILAYAAKYASAFYGPFREAAGVGAAVRRPARLPDGPGQRRARRCAKSRSTSTRARTW